MKIRMLAMMSVFGLVVLSSPEVFACGGHCGCKGACAGGSCSHEAQACSTEAPSCSAVPSFRATTESGPAPVVDHVGNTICPVMGNPVPLKDGVGQVTYEYKGKIFNLCCPGCIEAFKADPERYSARVEKNS